MFVSSSAAAIESSTDCQDVKGQSLRSDAVVGLTYSQPYLPEDAITQFSRAKEIFGATSKEHDLQQNKKCT